MTDQTKNTNEPAEDLNDQMRRRRQEADELRAGGIDPYPHTFDRVDQAAEIVSAFKDESGQQDVAIAGRIVALRRMGKASFFHLQDSSGRVQVYVKRDDLGDAYRAIKLYDLGDIVGVKGFMFRTRTGEVTVHAREVSLLAKSLRPLPVGKQRIDEEGKRTVYDPLSDKELRYRQRYVDLLANTNVRDVFRKRANIITAMRAFLDSRGFLEVETPILQPLYGGASARPFTTHHNALDIDLFLRIADELYLKRLIVGGFDAVYEISKDFRNEGMDRSHNPEFTMMELYVAYKDYVWMMDLVEEMFRSVAESVNGSPIIEVNGRSIDLSRPWTRVSLLDAVLAETGEDLSGKNEDEVRKAAKRLDVEVDASMGLGACIDAIYSYKVEPTLQEPTFIMDHPVEMSPLAKRHRSKAGLVERFEGIILGKEMCNAFSELNDPLDQRSRFEEQMKMRSRGDQEAQMLDEDFLRALEYGMPPTAGLGVGVDRFIMLLTGQESIRDVILFPQMRPERSSSGS